MLEEPRVPLFFFLDVRSFFFLRAQPTTHLAILLYMGSLCPQKPLIADNSVIEAELGSRAVGIPMTVGPADPYPAVLSTV